MLADVPEEAADRISTQLLLDFCTLLSFRWTMEVTLINIRGCQYAFGVNQRITVADRTIRAAIGDLSNHVEFLRGTAQATPEDLANYKECKKKWKVPDQVTESASGWDATEQAGTSSGAKRKRFY